MGGMPSEDAMKQLEHIALAMRDGRISSVTARSLALQHAASYRSDLDKIMFAAFADNLTSAPSKA